LAQSVSVKGLQVAKYAVFDVLKQTMSTRTSFIIVMSFLICSYRNSALDSVVKYTGIYKAP